MASMKTPGSILFTICLFLLIGCGGDEGSGTDAANSPGETVEQLAYAMEAGNGEKIQQLMPTFKMNVGAAQFDEVVKQVARNAVENGGIASITIDKEEIDGDKATVTATLANGNGGSSVETFTLVKKDDRWVIATIDTTSSPAQADPTPKDDADAEPTE